MKKILSIALCFFLFGVLPLRAEDTTKASTGTLPNVISTEVTGAKAEVAADKLKVAEEKTQITENAKAAHMEERDLHKQIREARTAGDAKKVEALRAQLKAVHQASVGKMGQDKGELKTAKKELRTDRKAAVKSQVNSSKAAVVNTAETTKAKKRGWWGL